MHIFILLVLSIIQLDERCGKRENERRAAVWRELSEFLCRSSPLWRFIGAIERTLPASTSATLNVPVGGNRQCFCQSSWASLRATSEPGMSRVVAMCVNAILKGVLYINHYNTLKSEQCALG